MALSAPHVCAHAGCRVLVRGAARCPSHVLPRFPGKGGESTLYDTAKWRIIRRNYLRAHPTCCTPGCGNASRHADHVQPHRGDPALFYSTANLQPLCHPCHSRKTAARDGGFGNPRRTP